MMNPKPKDPQRQITPRDVELLTAIDRHPMTSAQLLALSETFPAPFTHERLVRRRLSQLREAGYLKSFPYATAGRGGAPHYWKLSRDGYRLLYGETPVPRRRYFEAISPGHHHHTLCLGELLTHLAVMAHREGVAVRQFSRENQLRIETETFTLYPDCAFQLVTPGGRSYNFVVELDNGTERIRSRLDVESIERKLRGYDAHQSQFDAVDPERYLVLFVTTRSPVRLNHILDLAGMVMENPQRTVFIGADITQFLAGNPFRDSLFQDHRGLKRMLLPRGTQTTKSPAPPVRHAAASC